MATTASVKETLKETPEVKPSPITGLEALLKAPNIKGRFEQMLGKKAAGFISSILSAVNVNPALKTCDPRSIIAGAAIAASLDLPINPNLGFAFLVPYSGKAQFQCGWKGIVQLAIRTNQYRSMNASEVYEDELDYWNPITGEFAFTDQKTWKHRYENKRDKIVGYVAFFRLTNGFEKYLYMTRAQVETHGKQYSKSYHNEKGNWKLRFDAMALKTVVKLILSKWGILSIEMQTAMAKDQAIVNADETLDYADVPALGMDDSDSGVVAEESTGEGIKGADGKDIPFPD